MASVQSLTLLFLAVFPWMSSPPYPLPNAQGVTVSPVGVSVWWVNPHGHKLTLDSSSGFVTCQWYAHGPVTHTSIPQFPHL